MVTYRNLELNERKKIQMKTWKLDKQGTTIL